MGFLTVVKTVCALCDKELNDRSPMYTLTLPEDPDAEFPAANDPLVFCSEKCVLQFLMGRSPGNGSEA